jgi:hypothetical protein
MARSVATPSGTHTVVYLAPDLDPDDDSYFLEDIVTLLSEAFPSLGPTRKAYWLDRECRVYMDNLHARVTISSYCGLYAIALVPVDDSPLALHWCEQVAPRFRTTIHEAYPDAALRRLGSASNGEAFFEPINRRGGLVTSKEGTLW